MGCQPFLRANGPCSGEMTIRPQPHLLQVCVGSFSPQPHSFHKHLRTKSVPGSKLGTISYPAYVLIFYGKILLWNSDCFKGTFGQQSCNYNIFLLCSLFKQSLLFLFGVTPLFFLSSLVFTEKTCLPYKTHANQFFTSTNCHENLKEFV